MTVEDAARDRSARGRESDLALFGDQIRSSRLSRLIAIVTAGGETFSQRARLAAMTVSPSDWASAMALR